MGKERESETKPKYQPTNAKIISKIINILIINIM